MAAPRTTARGASLHEVQSAGLVRIALLLDKAQGQVAGRGRDGHVDVEHDAPADRIDQPAA
jgi:hypothetical protein